MTTTPDCTVTLQPDFLRCTPHGDLETSTLHVRIDPPAPCRTIRITVPTGNGAGDLAAAPSELATATPSWKLTHPAPGVIEASTDGNFGVSLDLQLTGLLVGPDPGPVDITVTTMLDDGTEHTVTRQLIKDFNDFAITGLRPEPLQTTYDGSVELLWQGPKTTPKPTYYLWRSDGKPVDSPINVNDKNGECRYQVKNLTSAANAFLLKATGPGNKEARGVTAVAVTHGDVHAGALSANGNTTLLKSPVTCLDETVVKTKRYKSTTDGFLIANLTTRSAGERATLEITVSPGGSYAQPAVTRTLHADAAHIPVDIQLPVPAGATLKLELTGAAPKAQASWFALGGGQLTEQSEADQ
ncbi:hypothetical protein [Streptomyces sp. NPDC037389]|uniref:hypothetical protein n=1 Tax=Streptomyces sp. NPDC037389 TaxID=3155369 RepID=UPI0033EB4228